MVTTYRVKNIPSIVRQYFERRFPTKDGFKHDFYWYKGIYGKTYGCHVYLKHDYYHNATQATIKGFKTLLEGLKQ